jgi:hypothetical protein
MTSDQKIEHILAIVGALIPILSAAASFVNHLIRQKTDAGEQVSPMLLNTGALLNATSINVDKAVQLAKMARGKPVLTTVTEPVQPTTQVTQLPPNA